MREDRNGTNSFKTGCCVNMYVGHYFIIQLCLQDVIIIILGYNLQNKIHIKGEIKVQKCKPVIQNKGLFYDYTN